MRILNSEIQFCADTMIVETLLRNESLLKTAQASMITELIDKVKHYVGNNINPNDRAGSVLNILAPGAISIAFSAMGLGWFGILLGLAMRIFHIDVKSILGTIWEKLKSALGGDKQMTSAQVDGIVQGAVADHTAPATENEAAQAEKLVKTESVTLKDAKILKFAMMEFEKHNFDIVKAAGFFDLFSSRKSKTASMLSVVLGWIFKVALASAGLMVAGDVINKFLGRPSALDNTVQNGKPVEKAAPQGHVSTQTKFPVQSSYHEEHVAGWAENVPNNSSAIEDMLIRFAKQVYKGLDGLDSNIKSTVGFQVIRDRIVNFNMASEGDPIVYIPNYFTSKKQIVDYFIDDVAEKAK